MATKAVFDNFLRNKFVMVSGPGDLLFSSLLITPVISRKVMGLFRIESLFTVW